MSTLEEKIRQQEKHWDKRASEFIDKFEYKDKRLQKIARRYAKWEYKAEHNKVAKPIFKGYNYFLAYGVGGGLEDSLASQIALLTGIDKKHAQRVNAIFGNADQFIAVFGGYEGFNYLNDKGEQTLYITVPIAALNIIWNAYRFFDKSEKAKPAIGYPSIVAHGVIYAQRSVRGTFTILPFLTDEAKRKASQEGTTPLYAGACILLEGAKETAKETATDIGKVAASIFSLNFFKDAYK